MGLLELIEKDLDRIRSLVKANQERIENLRKENSSLIKEANKMVKAKRLITGEKKDDTKQP